MELPLEDVQGVAQDLAVVSLALGNQVQLLLHGAADGGEHQLHICGSRDVVVSTRTRGALVAGAALARVGRH